MARRMDHENAARRERVRRHGFEVIETERVRARRLRRANTKADRARKGHEDWRRSDYSYCIAWLMSLHRIGFTKASKMFDATPDDIRRLMLDESRQRRVRGQAP